ncbi:Flp pilus assembly complex ATPase component TadA [Latilactobacillus curvatus]|uniref:competence type IV pilus ATPase ComGA n=1 Tax=Latilactobacillus curvatus TaxID=28038 RepID=UPI000978C5DD|nr:competence type IV pilus ATPase ComGA [Latilactobacillus curvatus]ASN62265.1 competence protein ComGA [Latilactobacillus curvatus]MCM6844022.1 Flp pilus assembly complex ATPase component TadA [Latilactobacillus curvatus]MCM6861091.1 Flp pilus assembly complex ATPase component TadA [Latilactobacillus curvatus]MCM6868389.1 Flp pilus assembly complex ATPase component TadA [Latilactobacillus curvatus]MCS8581826.1 competence protein ComGA [Latilactobacillus curvatus]
MTEVLTTLLQKCATEKAQDLYFRPLSTGWAIIERLATGLKPLQKVTLSEGNQWLNQMKYQAGMDISETRRPQTGRSAIEVAGELIYLRLATVGDFLNRESLVVRFIYPIGQTYHCDDSQILSRLMQLIQQPGLLLFAGPTGSGKTTSLYYLAEQVMQDKMVVAIEDPIEIQQPAFLQLQVNEAAGLTYAALLKISLRLRPDTLIIGEIRDLQTAQHAVSAALSGHLVLSTIHARSTTGVMDRLLDLGISHSQLTACLAGVAYQSLVVEGQNVAAHYELATAQQLEEAVHED